jgi:hypothetical protein
MAVPDLVCVMEGSGALIFKTNSFDHSVREGDLFNHTVEGITTRYRVESAVLDVESHVGDPHAANQWTTIVQRVTASIVP